MEGADKNADAQNENEDSTYWRQGDRRRESIYREENCNS